MENITRISIVCCITVFFGLSLPAQEPQVFSLADVQRYAMENNRDIRGALLTIDVADKQRWAVTATGFPQIEITANYQNLVDRPTQLIPGEFFDGDPGSKIAIQFGTPHNASYGISISQLIFSGSYFVGVQASSIYMELSQRAYERTRLDVKATVTKSYHLVLVAEENRAILASTLENLRKTHYEIEEMHKEGFTENTDVKQLQISINELENAVRALDQQIEIAYKLLKLQMGLPLGEPIQLSDNLENFLNEIDVKETVRVAFDPFNSISMKAMATQEELARLSLKNEATTFLPTMVGFATMKRDAQRDQFDFFDPDKDWYPTTVVGIQMSWPIFSGGSKMFKLQKARIELNQTRIKKQQVEEGLNLQHEQIRSEAESAVDRYRNARDNRELAMEIYDMTHEKFREGLSTSLDLTQAHNQYLASERAYLQAVTDLLNADTDLKKILEIL